MIQKISAKKAANDITLLLNEIYRGSPERFPVKILDVAKEYSKQLFPTDPILHINGDCFPRFDGALKRIPNKKGWGILYNSDVSEGRKNFTIAHEFGHYLLHRKKHPEGISCDQDAMLKWGSNYQKIESEANDFASNLLMPLDDLRQQINVKVKPNFDDLKNCAERYGVSLTAVILRWLEYTERQSVVVASREGFILWSWSSKNALGNKKYFKTSNGTIEIPAASLATQPNFHGEITHDAKVWFNQPCQELVIVSKRYDMTMSLLHFENTNELPFDEKSEEDVLDLINRKSFSR